MRSLRVPRCDAVVAQPPYPRLPSDLVEVEREVEGASLFGPDVLEAQAQLHHGPLSHRVGRPALVFHLEGRG